MQSFPCCGNAQRPPLSGPSSSRPDKPSHLLDPGVSGIGVEHFLRELIAIPYIAQERRKPIDAALNALDLTDDGELNYAITRLCLRYLACTVAGMARYVDFNAVMGVLTCVQLEFYRMQVVPYEQSKIVQHGNVRP